MLAKTNTSQRRALASTIFTLATITAALGGSETQIADADRRVQYIFETTYAEKCRSLMASQNQEPSQPKIYQLTFNYGDETYPPRPYRVYEYLCFEGPYNQGFVYYGVDDYYEIYPISFPVPTYEVKREGEDYLSPVSAINVTGFTSTDMITNASFDEKTNSISSFDKWTGPAETFSIGKWIFSEGRFVIQTYDVDAQWDGRRIPQRIFGPGLPQSME